MIDNETHRDAAHDFIKALGLEPTPEAISQLSGPFAECLRIMCERGYGTLWRSKGWKGLVHDVLNKSGRLRYRSWLRNEYNPDDPHRPSAPAGLPLAGLRPQRPLEWGELGEPG